MAKHRFDAVRMEDDAAVRGWNRRAWAKQAKVAESSVTYFCHGRQTPIMAARLARPLKRTAASYRLKETQ